MSLLIRRFAVAVAFTVLAALPLGAQRVRGAVLRGDGTTPAVGVVVVASSAKGTVVARTLSNDAGAFELRLPASGSYALSALRIGFRPSVVESVAVADTGTTVVNIVLSSAAIPLAAVSVRSEDVCGSAGDPQSQVVQLWGEARTALTSAALWAREQMEAEWISYHRELRPGTESVRSQSVRLTQSATTHAFAAWDADSLAARGYVVPEGSSSMYYAPDPDVLLSNSFAETHCFHLEPPAANAPTLVGIGFAPQRTRGNRVEIQGTLWIDRASSELRRLEFRYVGLPAITDEASPGGSVEFLHLPEGPWMVSRWFIRMPNVGAPERPEKGYQVTLVRPGEAVMRAIEITGGIVSTVSRRGRRLYQAEGGGIALQLVRPDSTVSVAFPHVSLVGTDYEWRGDSSGLVRAAPVLDGHYTARIATAEMIALGTPPLEREVTVLPTRTRLDSVSVPSARELVRTACGQDVVKDGFGALYGTVLDAKGRPAPGRAVVVSWLGRVDGLRNGRIYAGFGTTGTLSDDNGAWRVCEVPRTRTLTVRAAGDDGVTSAQVTVPEWRWSVRVPLQVGIVAGGADGAVDSTAATIELQVHDQTGRVLDAATLELGAGTGEQRKVTTDNRGRALVTSFPPGVVKLRAKRAGYATGDVVFSVAPGRNTVPVILDKSTLPMLDSVRVVGNRKSSSRLDGFETRRARREATASFNSEDIRKRSPGEISDLLRSVGSIRMVDSSGVMVAQLSRGFKLDKDAKAQPCNMRVVFDGVLMPVEAGVNIVQPGQLHGIEVFASTSRVPAGLGVMAADVACGLIAIWTTKP